MLAVILDVRARPQDAAPLLAQLTGGAVEGLVKEVVLVGPHEGLVAALCEETGAEAAPTFEAALEQVRQPWVLGADAHFRLREGWIESLKQFLEGHRKAALVRGRHGFLGGRPYAVLVERGRAVDAQDVRGLRRRIRLRPARIG
jgi:hypothetical protein